MFLTILQDSGKMTRLWYELTIQTRHVKLSVGETILPQFNSCDFKSLPLRLIILIAKQTFRGNWRLLNSKGISFSIKGISNLWFQRPFLPKPKNSCLYKKNFKSKTSNNENQVEINYRKTPNKTNFENKVQLKNFDCISQSKTAKSLT